MQGKSSVPPNHYYSLDDRNEPLVPASNVPQKEDYRVDRNVYRHRDNHDKIAFTYQYSIPSPRNYIYGVLDGPPRQYDHVRYNIAVSSSTSMPSQSPARLFVVNKN